jgi:hypothetical protein
MNEEETQPKDVKQLYELCKTLKNRYLNSARKDQYEPTWKLDPFDAVFEIDKFGINGIKGWFGAEEDECNVTEALEHLSALMDKDGTIYTCKMGIFPKRVVHDGYKVGTTSWVFMGRRNSPIILAKTKKDGMYRGNEVCIIQRRIPLDALKVLFKPSHPELEPIVWAGYFMDPSLRLEFGPCFTKEEIFDAIEGNGRITITHG